MPQIDVYTAPSKPVTPDQPMAFMESGANPAKGVEQQSKLLGHQLSVIAGNVVAQQDSVDFGLANANYLAAPKRIGMDVAKDPEVIENPLLYQKKFNEELQKYQQKLIEETPNKRIHGAIQDMFETRNPEIQYQASLTGLKLAADASMAGLAVAEESYARLGAEAITQGRSAAQYVTDYRGMVKDAVNNRHMTKEQGQKAIEKMETNMLEKEMFIYAKGGEASRDKLYQLSRSGYFDGIDPVRHSQIMNMASLAADAEERAVTQKAAKNRVEDTERYWSLFGQNQLSYDVVDRIIAGDTNASPQTGLQLREAMLNRDLPKEPGAEKKVRDPRVGEIQIKWGKQGPPTIARIDKEREDLTRHVEQNGISEDARIYFQHLDALYQQQQNVMSAQATKSENVARRLGEDLVGSSAPPSFGSARTKAFMNSINKRVNDELMVEIHRPGFDRSAEGMKAWVERRRKELMGGAAATGKDTRSPEQKTSEDYANEGR